MNWLSKHVIVVALALCVAFFVFVYFKKPAAESQPVVAVVPEQAQPAKVASAALPVAVSTAAAQFNNLSDIYSAIVKGNHEEAIRIIVHAPAEQGEPHAQYLLGYTPLGTAGGFLNAVRLSGEKPEAWLVLNGDSLVFADLSLAAAELSDPAVAGVLIGCLVADASRYGTLAIGPAGDLRGFTEKRPGKGIINAGVYLLRDSVVREFPGTLPLSFEQEVFPQLIARGVWLKVCAVDAPFLDIGTYK